MVWQTTKTRTVTATPSRMQWRRAATMEGNDASPETLTTHGTPDYLDGDSDGDGTLDINERGPHHS